MTKHIFWLASYPKSGNTLLRTILASLFFSDSGKFSFELLKKIVGFEELSRLEKCYNTRPENLNLRDWKSRNSLIFENMKEIQNKINLGFEEDFAFFKTHFNAKNFDGQSFLIDNYLRGVIYIYRDPRDVCISWSRHSNISKNESLDFMLNKDTSINWIDHENFVEYDKNIPVYISTWDNHISSWINYNFKCPYLIISYEELVYDKEKIILKLIEFFKNNYKIKIINEDEKIKNILKYTSFKSLKQMERTKGFNERVNNNFFAVGKKEQWRTELNENQIKLLEQKFGSTMKKLEYKLHNNKFNS